MNGFEVIRKVIPDCLTAFIRNEFSILIEAEKSKAGIVNYDSKFFKIFGDEQVRNSFSIYSPIFGESLLVFLLPIIENTIGRKLYPCYSYARSYYNGAILRRHLDRESCQYSATFCIHYEDTSWPIFMKPKGKKAVKLVLDPGDIVVYAGCDVEHWRNTYKTNGYTMQAFLHYVDANGKYSDFKFDRRDCLGLQS